MRECQQLRKEEAFCMRHRCEFPENVFFSFEEEDNGDYSLRTLHHQSIKGRDHVRFNFTYFRWFFGHQSKNFVTGSTNQSLVSIATNYLDSQASFIDPNVVIFVKTLRSFSLRR